MQYVNRLYRRTGSLWEGRYKSSVVQVEAYLLACMRYIELNPVRAGMVADPGGYRWSSYRANGLAQPDARLTPHPLYLGLEAEPASRSEIKVETFPFTRYGTIPARVSFVSSDAVQDDKRGLVFHARLDLQRANMQVDERLVHLGPGMAVTAEIKTGSRRVIEYFLSPLMKTTGESLRER